jgi:hypothetical protein
VAGGLPYLRAVNCGRTARSPKHDDAERYQAHSDEIAQMDAVASARKIEDDGVPALWVKADKRDADVHRNHSQDSP